MTTTTICPPCGAKNPAGAAYCANCGRPLFIATLVPTPRPAVVCPACGRENQPGAAFCGQCGAAMGVPAVPSVADAPPSAPLVDTLLISEPPAAAPPIRVASDPVIPARAAPPPVALPPVAHVPAAVPDGGAARGGRGCLLTFVILAGLLLLGSAAAWFILPESGENLFQSLAESGRGESIPPDGSESSSESLGPGDGEDDGEAGAAAEDPTVIDGPSPTATPTPTATPSPTPTPTPTSTATATITPTPTDTPTPTTSPTPTMSPSPTATEPAAVTCLDSPGPRWGPTLWDRYQDRLGCAVSGEMRPIAAYQEFQRGFMLWRQDADRIYVLYNDGTYASYRDDSPPDIVFSPQLKNGFGYLWTNNPTVSSRLGQPKDIEFNTTDFAVQDFAGGTIFYFIEKNAHNYVLFNDNGTWTSTQE